MKLVRMQGLDVLKALCADPRTATIPVVMHSSSTEKCDIAACYENGANSYVRKATDYDELRRKMRQVHDFWMTVNERYRPAGTSACTAGAAICRSSLSKYSGAVRPGSGAGRGGAPPAPRGD